MNRESILKEIYEREDFSTHINEIGGNLSEELRSAFLEVMCSFTEEKLIEKHALSYFTAYVKKIITNVWMSDKFKKEIRTPFPVINTQISTIHSLQPYYELEELVKRLPQIPREALEGYLKAGSLNKMTKGTGISRKYLTECINEVREFIRKNYELDPQDYSEPTKSNRDSEDVQWDLETENY
jgi:hypothetical protein